MSPNTILILGAGPRVGYSVAQRFKAEGYNIAVASRKPGTEAATRAGFLPITVDLTNIQSVEEAFIQVTKEYGPPNVVVYNAATVTFPKDFANPFATIEPEAFVKDLNLNLVGAYIAIKEAVKGFDKLGADVPKAFIATGNVLPWQPHPAGLTLGSGKAALTHLLAIGAEAYKGSNYRFYFASEVTTEGGPVKNLDLSGSAHAEVYWELANEKVQGAWDVRFLGNGKTAPAKDITFETVARAVVR